MGTSNDMCHEAMEAMVRRRFSALDEGNFAILDELFHPTYVLNLPGVRGPMDLEATKRFYKALYSAFPNLRHTIIEQITGRDKAVTRWVARGNHQGSLIGEAPTGNTVEFSGINIYTIKAGKFAESHVNWDLLSLFSQIGAVTRDYEPGPW